MAENVRLTMLNSLAGGDFEESLDRQRDWGIEVLDLKDGIFGKSVLELTDDEAERAASMARERGLEVYCLSTGLFFGEVEEGEEEFRSRHLDRVERACRLAGIFRPRFVRLLAARTSRRHRVRDAVAYLRAEAPWVLEFYGRAVEEIAEAGFEVTIENEIGGCLLSNPQEVLAFFHALPSAAQPWFTWDVQNMWQMGTFPAREVYRTLRPLIGYLHLKGGMAEEEGTALKWRSALEDATWPVGGIVRAVASDGVSPVICLNYPHGEAKPGYDYDDLVQRDLAYVRSILREVS